MSVWQRDVILPFLKQSIEEGDQYDEIYLSVGCYVDRVESIDQQLPMFIRKHAARAGKISGLAILFDPKFVRSVPLALLETLSTLPSFKSNGYMHECGSLRILVVNEYLEASSRFFQLLQDWVVQKLQSGSFIRLAVFTQPYLRVEENHEIIDMYHSVLSRLQMDAHMLTRFRYLHLAAYAMENPERGTRMWQLLPGQLHDQDLALLKEIARYKGSGPSFGVGCYAAFPGTKFKILNPQSGIIDYDYIQRQVEDELKACYSQCELLEENEVYINDI